MALEEAFGLDIPDVDAVSLTTPRKVIDYFEKRLAPADTSQCSDQMSPTWTKAEITQVVTRLMDTELGITRFGLDDRFAQDLGVD